MTRRQPEVCSEGSSPNQRLKLTGAAVLVSVVQRFSRRPRQLCLAVRTAHTETRRVLDG
jgi:hypothetical protein